MTLDDLNACDHRRFVEAVGWVFEHSAWVADRAWAARPFVSIDELHATMTREVTAATRQEQLALIQAHPDLGARARMSESSTVEQSNAGLDRLSPTQFERLQQLNAAYRDKFGFPFLFAVKGSTVEQILAALEQRLPRTMDEELMEALEQVSRIALFRLETALR